MRKFKNSSNEGPDFDLQSYFSGSVKGWGILQSPRGHILRRFDVDMIGTWNGDDGILKESFRFYDGENQDRIWIVKKTDQNTYEAKAGDIVGTAKGFSQKSAMQWAYKVKLRIGKHDFSVFFDDKMFFMNDGVLIDRVYLKKFGFKVAELYLFLKKVD